MHPVKSLYKQCLQVANKFENINIKNWAIRKIKEESFQMKSEEQVKEDLERLKRIEQIYNLYYKQNEYKYMSILNSKLSDIKSENININ